MICYATTPQGGHWIFLSQWPSPVIGNGHPKLDFITVSACELKGVESRDVEFEWAKLACFFFLRDRAVKKKVLHSTDLNRHLVHVDARFKRENAVVF